MDSKGNRKFLYRPLAYYFFFCVLLFWRILVGILNSPASDAWD